MRREVKNLKEEELRLKSKVVSVTGVGVRLFLLALVLFVITLSLRVKGNIFLALEKLVMGSKPTLSTAPLTPTPIPNEFPWKTYTSREMNFTMQYPPSLSTNDLGSVGGYIDFIRFEEEPSLGLSDKGIAVGITALDLAKETKTVKDEIDKNGGATLVNETKISFKNFTANRLYYKPTDPTINEERVIVIVRPGGKYTYSISTVPEQIDKVLNGFSFISD